MKVACVLARGFEDSEFRQPYDALKQAGHDLTIVGIEAGQQVNGDKGRETATVERAFSDVTSDQFDALFVPGGVSPDRLRCRVAVRDRALVVRERWVPCVTLHERPLVH